MESMSVPAGDLHGGRYRIGKEYTPPGTYPVPARRNSTPPTLPGPPPRERPSAFEARETLLSNSRNKLSAKKSGRCLKFIADGNK
jgi:hypothetical protein